MLLRAASTIASESRLGYERTPRDNVWDEKDDDARPGAEAAAGVAVPSPTDPTEEIGAAAAAEEGSAGSSAAESNTWLTGIKKLFVRRRGELKQGVT